MSPSVSGKDHGPELEEEAGQGADEASQGIASAHRGAESQEETVLEIEPEERASLSEKERQNEEVNERDNCSASSVSSPSSTLEREEKEDKLSEDRSTGKWNPFSTCRGSAILEPAHRLAHQGDLWELLTPSAVSPVPQGQPTSSFPLELTLCVLLCHGISVPWVVKRVQMVELC